MITESRQELETWIRALITEHDDQRQMISERNVNAIADNIVSRLTKEIRDSDAIHTRRGRTTSLLIYAFYVQSIVFISRQLSHIPDSYLNAYVLFSVCLVASTGIDQLWSMRVLFKKQDFTITRDRLVTFALIALVLISAIFIVRVL